MRGRSCERAQTRGLLAAGAGLCLLAAAAVAADPETRGIAPVVLHTGSPPTGYEVTFRLDAPEAQRVQIRGEWYFARPLELRPRASTANFTVESQGLMPSEWQPGDIPLAHPNSTGGNWPVTDMARDADGVWSYTIPLPSGVFTYGYYVDCSTEDRSGCRQVPDPGNPPWNMHNGVVTGSAERSSQVYVPSDPAFDTLDFSWQAPSRESGDLTHVTYRSPGHVTPADENYLVVYTPPGYDENRDEAYPTLYLNHGGGGSEMSWSTQGNLRNIVDNLIALGEIRPLVVVMANASGYPDSADNEAFRKDLIGNIIPWVEAHYRVSGSASDRAFSGLSAGGLMTNQLMLYNTAEFGYYGMMSAGLPPETQFSDAQIAALRAVSVFVGSGWQDTIHAAGFTMNGVVRHTGPLREVGALVQARIPVTVNFINGGHQWYVWRILLKDFLTRVAFGPPFAALP